MKEGVVAVIPARWGSTRFPGKALVRLGGVPILARVIERVRASVRVDGILVATDDERIRDAARSFGVEARMTSPDHACGTERVAEVAARLEQSVIVNVQGDEPFLEPEAIDAAVDALSEDPEAAAATVAFPTSDAALLTDPNRVKVVFDDAGRALYFSRAPIPWNREGGGCTAGHVHVGLYVYRRAFLLEFVRMPAGRLEALERLEQLRILESGRRIRVVTGPWESPGIDVPADLEAAEKRLSRSGG